MVKVDVLNERFNGSSLFDLLGTHSLCDFAWSSFNTSNESMAELSVLQKFFYHDPAKIFLTYLVAIFDGFYEDCLLTSESTLEDDDNSAVFEAKKSDKFIMKM